MDLLPSVQIAVIADRIHDPMPTFHFKDFCILWYWLPFSMLYCPMAHLNFWGGKCPFGQATTAAHDCQP
jgi:hypothetical protein